MDHRITVISPSYSVVRRYRVLAPSLRGREIEVIEHGLSDNLVTTLCAARDATHIDMQGRLRIVLLGRITREKGSELLAKMINELAHFCDVFLLGAGENGSQFAAIPNVTVVDEYSSAELGAHLITLAPHLGLLLSVVPETFSYTLSELWAAGIPALATRLGAFSDRIVDGENGWLESLDAQRIVKRLMLIDEDREALAVVRGRVQLQPVRTAQDMVSEYRLLRTDQGVIPLRRYYLPRKTHRNPYRNALQSANKTVLFVDRQATYRAVLKEFLQFSANKIEHTPRVSVFSKAVLKRVVDFFLAALSARKSEK
jgi:glycosyltransferase involved in cell wall biosynthesis